jgi:putative membrane protein
VTPPESNSRSEPADRPAESAAPSTPWAAAREFFHERQHPPSAVKDPQSANELAAARTDLAAERTMMAVDRSLMAWIRTGLSMISFGFTLYKVLEGFQASGAFGAHAHSPRAVGMFLTGLGTASILLGTIEYWQRLIELRAYQDFKTWRPSFVMALIMSATGVFLFVGIIAKLL